MSLDPVPAERYDSRIMSSLGQLSLFPESVALARIRPERNEWRFYRLAVWPDLFGRALLARAWGRIGTPGRVRLDAHADAGAALNALATLARKKRRRGYQDIAFTAPLLPWPAPRGRGSRRSGRIP